MEYIKIIFNYTSALKKYYLIIGVCTVGVSLLGLLAPLLTGWAIDEISKGTEASLSRAVWLAVLIFLSDFLSNIINNYNGYIGDQMGILVRELLSNRYFEHLLKLPQRYFDKEMSGKVINRLERSVGQISDFMNAMSNNFLQFVFSTLFALVVIAYYSWPVALMLATLYPLYVYMTLKSSGVWLKYQEKINNNLDIALARFTETITQINVVKSFVQEKRERNFFASQFKKVNADVKPQSRYWHVKDTQRRTALNVIFFLVYLLIFYQGIQGDLSTGEAVALILYAGQIRIPIFTISFLVDRFQRVIANSKDYFEVMELEPEPQSGHGQQLNVKKGQIEFKDVSFSYDDQEQVLSDISFLIEPGQKVALVGESGGGKTTITNLLLGFYAPKSGYISIDGTLITEVTQSSLRRSIGAVFQSPSLFSGTIKENIGYAKSKEDLGAIKKAAKAAHAEEFITNLPKGYDSQIGEKGVRLSGGQKQRIAIARAIYKDAPLLILDEATSSLDSKAELHVQSALKKLMEKRTTLIIAHRLSTIAHVDKILVIEDGRIKEQGSPSELAASGGIYAELLALQQRGGSAEEFKHYDIVG